MAKSINFLCFDCGTLLTMHQGLLGWNSAKCPKCKKVVKPEDLRNVIGYCPHCNRNVAINVLQNNGQLCPSCHTPLELPHAQAPSRHVFCPSCNHEIEVDHNASGPIRCDYCLNTFSLAPAKNTASSASSASSDSSTAAAPRPIRISSEKMPNNCVLWRYPADHIDPSSTIELQPGTVALLVSGDHCVGIMSESGTLKDTVTPNASIRVVFARPHFTFEKRWGIGYIQIRDAYYRITPRIADFTDRPKANGVLTVRINDIDAFAKRLQFSTCTVQEVNDLLNNSYIFPAQRIMEQASQRTIDERQCDLTELIDWKEDILVYFEAFSNNILSRDWGLVVSNCEISLYPRITAEMIDAISDVETILTTPASWATSPFSIHLPNKPQYTSTVEVYGTFQLKIANPNLLRSNPDMIRWKKDVKSGNPSAPAREVSSFLGKQLYAALTLALQDQMNAHDQMVPLLMNTYLYRTQQDMMIVLNNELPYLSDHGLQMSTFNMQLKVIDESPLMRTWNAANQMRDMSKLEIEMSDMQRANRMHETTENAREQLHNYLERANLVESQARIDEENAANAHVRDVNAMLRSGEKAEIHSNLTHSQNVRAMQQTAELNTLKANLHADNVRNTIGINRVASDAQRAEELAAKQHELHMTALDGDIQREKLNQGADYTSYTLGNAVSTAQAQADITRVSAQAKADAEVYVGEAGLHLSAAAQNIAQQSARAAHNLAQDKANADFARSMKQAQFHLDADVKRRSMQNEIEKLRLELNALLQYSAQEADIARSKAQSEADRLRTQRDYDLKTREQDNRLILERERMEHQRSEQSKADAQRAHQLMEELRRLQRECSAAAANSARSNEYSAMQNQLSDLQRSIESIVENLASSQNAAPAPAAQPVQPVQPTSSYSNPYGGAFGEVNRPASPFGTSNSGFGEVNRPASPFGTSNGGLDEANRPASSFNSAPQSAPHQPGMTYNAKVCPSCGRPVSSFSVSCIYCNTRLKP